LIKVTERGLVIDTNESIAQVLVTKNANCKNCNACSIGKGRAMVTEADNSINAKKDDSVLVEVSDRQAIKAWLLVFGLPLIALFIGVFGIGRIVQSLGFASSSDAIGGIVGFILFVLVSFSVYFYSGHLKKNGRYSLKIVKILSSH